MQSDSIATGTRNIERRTSPAESNSNDTNPGSSSSGRLACRTCSKPKYPERARKRGLEGKAEISVDVDKKGNVTNVRVARTSGHAELDKAAVEQARNWKFNAPNGSAQSVTAKVDFAIEGSKRSRQNRERRRKRVPAQQPVASTRQNTSAPSSPPSNNVPRTSTRQNPNPNLKRRFRRQRVNTLPPSTAYDQRQQSGSQTRLRATLKRPTSSNQNRVRRSRATSPSQTKLRQSLRSYQQNPSAPSTTSNEP